MPTFRHLTLCAVMLLVVTGCASLRPVVEDGVRFIPVELWTGADWDGTKQLRMTPVKTVGGKRESRVITGPVQWKHPHTGEMLTVYERTKGKQAGEKRQLYAITKDGSGLGRVYDARPGQADRHFSGEVIFPLGRWGRGEERTFRYVEYTDKGPAERVATLKIRRLDFTFKGVRHSLKFDWRLQDESGAVLFDERYVYSPGVGLVDFENRLKE